MRRTVMVLVVAGALLAGCGDDMGSSGAPGTGAPQPGDTAQPASEAPEALQFAAPLVGGGSLDFSQYAGTTVALWFWAPT